MECFGYDMLLCKTVGFDCRKSSHIGQCFSHAHTHTQSDQRLMTREAKI